MSGWFFSFEGPEGSGKSSHIRALADYLRSRRVPVRVTREPGGTPLGQRIRELLLHPTEGDWVDRAEVLLFLADRAQHVDQVLRPALARGEVILCDRYADSTLAYQGYGRGLPLDQLRALIAFATRGLQPHRTFLLDVAPEIGLQRRRQGGGMDRLDAQTLAFHRRVREGFLALARAEPERWIVVDASKPWDVVQRTLREHVRRLLGLPEEELSKPDDSPPRGAR
ncbi:MAG: dTMP kinase [Chloroflexi bacterium]|nr:dTMP kinase [Chloroflexota bacterium]